MENKAFNVLRKHEEAAQHFARRGWITVEQMNRILEEVERERKENGFRNPIQKHV